MSKAGNAHILNCYYDCGSGNPSKNITGIDTTTENIKPNYKYAAMQPVNVAKLYSASACGAGAKTRSNFEPL